MNEKSIYEAIAKRTNGNIYVGVVGPVRTGKSTFIGKFMESLVLPAISDPYERERATDEMPQSGSGRTVTTTEPKFVPREAVELSLDGTKMNVRLIDCVGFMVEGAEGAFENDMPRMVKTPWSDDAMPFTKAAEIGTERVVREHSTVAMLVTTDGSFGDIPREAYISAEERCVKELTDAGVPFAIILNSADPEHTSAIELAGSLEEKYNAPVALIDATKLRNNDILAILGLVVGEFPLNELCFTLPDWYSLLPEDHELISAALDAARAMASGASKFGDISTLRAPYDCFVPTESDAGTGCASFELPYSRELYFKTLSEECKITLCSEAELFAHLRDLTEMKRDYDKIKNALSDVRERGWGIVMPTRDELSITEPELVRQGAQYGIKIGAVAEAIHMVKTYIRTDVCPTVGTEEQTSEIIRQLSADYEGEPTSLLECKTFGKSLSELVFDGMSTKLTHMPDDARTRMGQTIERVINEGASGLICILV